MYHELNVVTKSVEIDAPPTKVYKAWTEPDHLVRWFTDAVDGWPGVGSTLSFKWNNFGFAVEYKISQLRPDQKIVYKARIPGVGTQVLTIELSRRGPKTIVKLSESGPENHKTDPKESGVESGWEMALGLLKNYVEAQFGKERECFFAMLPAQFEFAKLEALFKTHEGLTSWLRDAGAPPAKPGDPVEFTLDCGKRLSGKVLAITHHELALSWNEIDGYLELKSFPTSPDNKGLCLRGATYSPTVHSADDLESVIKDSLVKLFAAVSG